MKLPSVECNKTSPMISQHWGRWWLGAARQLAITWTNVDIDLCHHMVSLGPNKLIVTIYFNSILSICQRANHYELSFDWRTLCKKSPVLVSDDSVDIRIFPPLLIATWKVCGMGHWSPLLELQFQYSTLIKPLQLSWRSVKFTGTQSSNEAQGLKQNKGY